MRILEDQEQIKAAARERLATLQRAEAFQYLVQSPGWKEIRDFHVKWAEKQYSELRTVDTSDAARSMDLLRKWQIADDLLAREAHYIEQTLEQAKEILSTQSLMEAELMEKLRYEQSESTDPSRDRGGY